MQYNVTYKNLGIFLISLLLINIAVGFYNSFNKKKASNGLSVNYKITNTRIFETNPSDVTVDYISESSEMIEIFNKYQFSIDNLLNNQSANIKYDTSMPTMLPKRLINTDKIRTKCNWSPQISLGEGLKLTIDWYKEFYKNTTPEKKHDNFKDTF